MIRITNSHDVQYGTVKYLEYAGLSTDTKPTDTNIATGSLFMEVDTGDVYAYDEEGGEWNQVAALGGGS